MVHKARVIKTSLNSKLKLHIDAELDWWGHLPELAVCLKNLFLQGRTRFCSWFMSEGGEDIWTENKHDMITFLAKKVSSFAFWFLVCKHYSTLHLSLVYLLKPAGCQHLSSAHFSLRIKEIKNVTSSSRIHFTQSKQADITILPCHMRAVTCQCLLVSSGMLILH